MEEKVKKIPFIILLSFLILWSHCKRAEKPAVDKIVLKEKLEAANVNFILEKKIALPDISYPFLTLAGDKLYIYGYSTKGNNKVALFIYQKSLDSSSHSQRFFNMGEGPGDLGSGVQFYIFSDHIYVPDNTQIRVNIFDKEFNFIKFVKTPQFLPPTFIKNGEYCIAGDPEFNNKRELIYAFHIVKFPGLNKKEFQTIGPISVFDKSKKWQYGSIPEFYFFYKNEKIYFINMADYQISLFNIDGQMQKNVRVDVEKEKVPEDMKKTWLKEQGGSERFDLIDTVQPASWMIPLGKGFIVLRRPGYGTDCTGMAEGDYFDYQINLIGKTKFPCFYWIYKLRRGYFPRVYEYNNGYLYLITEGEEEYYVEKWKVME